MPRHERLGQPDLGDELGDGGFSLGQAANDPEPVDVGQGLVDEAELAEVVRLGDGGRERRADTGRGRGQGGDPRGAVASTTVYINGS